jgi:hypothetical protein
MCTCGDVIKETIIYNLITEYACYRVVRFTELLVLYLALRRSDGWTTGELERIWQESIVA